MPSDISSVFLSIAVLRELMFDELDVCFAQNLASDRAPLARY
jgi:hypothetical protein